MIGIPGKEEWEEWGQSDIWRDKDGNHAKLLKDFNKVPFSGNNTVKMYPFPSVF